MKTEAKKKSPSRINPQGKGRKEIVYTERLCALPFTEEQNQDFKMIFIFFFL